MKKHHMPEMKEGGVNVTPLIDVVMCLIIFFILVAKIGVSNGINKNITPPEAYLGVKISDMGNALALNLYPKPGASDEPLVVVDLRGEKQKEIKLVDGTKHPLQEVLKAMRADRKDLFKVIINASGDMRYAQIQMILQECAVSGVSNIYFNAKKKQVAG
jgi:biopolymer transport protein ExbD